MTYSPVRALVTGGTGFLGQHVLEAAADLDVWTLGRRRPRQVMPQRHIWLDDPAVETVIRAAVAVVRPDIVIHLAGTATGDLVNMYKINVLFAENLLVALTALCPHARIFLAGSAAEYGPVSEDEMPVTEATPASPRGSYGITKLAQTLHGLTAAERGLGVVIGRLFNVVGQGMPEHLALGSFAAQIARMDPEQGGQLITGDLDVERDFIAASDTAGLILSLVKRSNATGIFNFCSGVPLILRKLVEELVLRSGRSVKLWRDPGRLGVTSLKRQYGAPVRLRSFGMTVPALDPVRAASIILPTKTAPNGG